jgi:hypothetical protein
MGQIERHPTSEEFRQLESRLPEFVRARHARCKPPLNSNRGFEKIGGNVRVVMVGKVRLSQSPSFSPLLNGGARSKPSPMPFCRRPNRECDVVSTYRLWLLLERFKGAISAEEHERRPGCTIGPPVSGDLEPIQTLPDTNRSLRTLFEASPTCDASPIGRRNIER